MDTNKKTDFSPHVTTAEYKYYDIPIVALVPVGAALALPVAVLLLLVVALARVHVPNALRASAGTMVAQLLSVVETGGFAK
jgi:hypothetical protein